MVAEEGVVTPLHAALMYAEAGFPVIPLHTPNGVACDCPKGADCSSPAKHPRTLNGLKSASTDPGTIEGWFGKRWQHANVGVVVPNGFVVVDIDGPEGIEAIKQAGVVMPPTSIAQTGRGWHYLYRTSVLIRPAVGIFEHVDIRGPGSYIVAPPSKHANGKDYRWKIGIEAVSDAPAWIAERAEASRRRDVPADDPAEPIIEGGRNAHLASLAGSMRRRGFGVTAIEAALLATNRDRCVPPLPDDEVTAIAASVGRYAPAERHEAVGESPESSVVFPEPENRGTATLSDLGTIEYVEDLIRPGRIVVVAAEEGTGKSYAIAGELAIRVAVAGGSFAETWPILETGPVLVLSEMHADDDFTREDTILAALDRTRADLDARYFRLNLMTAAHGGPALMDDAWREYITGWMTEHDTRLMVIDTGTAATGVDPWGSDIQQVYRNLRQMLEALPNLAIVVVVHLKKPGQGRGGERGLSAVMGEWGRWNDITVMMENDGASLDRVKLTVRKRVRRERRLVLTKRDGLLVDPQEIEAGGTKVKPEETLAAIAANPGIGQKRLGELLGVSKATAGRYAESLIASRVVRSDTLGQKNAIRYFADDEDEDELLLELKETS